MPQVFFYIIVSVALVFHGAGGTCPDSDSIKPCLCSSLTDKYGDEFSIITCKNLQSEKALRSVLTATKGLEVFEFRLEDSSFRYIPSDAFIGTTYEVIAIVNSSIIALSDSDVAFKGLEENLHLIEILNCNFVNSWDWSQLSHLKHMMEVIIKDSDVLDITDGISKIQHIDLEGFVLKNNSIEWLDNHVFSTFTNLEYLYLDNNFIKALARTMFPRPAKLLKILGLSHNKLESLPADLFADMPALTSLYLSGNPLRTIDERIFKPIWKQLRMFFFYGTLLSCDCRLTWIMQADNSQKYIHAVCLMPSEHKGKSLTSLKISDLWC